MADLTVTVISWNTRDLLRACLLSLRDMTCKSAVEVHVVDNASSDGSQDMVRREFPRVLLTANHGNLGFAGANNQSWRQARGRYWMLLNSDAEVKAGSLDALVHFMDTHPRVGLASARLVNPDGTPQHCAQPLPGIGGTLLEATRLHKFLPASVRARALLGPYWTYDCSIPVGWTWGTALIARREAVRQVGPLSEAYFMYGEDLEWCLRMRRHGWEVWFCAEAEVLHHGSQSAALRWDDAARARLVLEGVYQAVGQHRGRRYVRALQAATLLGLGAEILFSRLHRRRTEHLLPVLDYHWRALNGSPLVGWP